jgi:two-component system KDP operon response regulator KdpE
MRRALIVDDDPSIRKLLSVSLALRSFEVFTAGDAFEGLQELRAVHPDIVILDLGLPDMDGSNVLASVRATSSVPVLILSARDAEEDIVGLLQAGADDYLTKPFNTNELVARMEAVLRRRTPTADPVLRAGPLAVDTAAREVSLDGEAVRLTPTEYEILRILITNAGRIITRTSLLRELWGEAGEAEAGSLRVHIAALRKKLERDPDRAPLIVNEIGVGYRLKA